MFHVEHRLRSGCGRVIGESRLGRFGRVDLGRIVAIVNQKGGVGKTTTTVNLAAALAIAEQPTLVIDADPQANSTRALGFENDPDRASIYDGLNGLATLDELILPCEDLPHLKLIPSTRDLVGAEVELVDAEKREYRLKRFLAPVTSDYHYTFIDCPPSLGLITLNALTAADAVLIPLQCEYLALEGVTQLMDTIERVRASLNPELAIGGVLMTMYDERTNLARQVVEEVRQVFGPQVYQTVIPRNIRLGEAPSHGQPIFLYDIRSKGSVAYFELAKEFLRDEAKGTGQRATQSDSRSTAQSSGAGVTDTQGKRPAPAGHRPDPT